MSPLPVENPERKDSPTQGVQTLHAEILLEEDIKSAWALEELPFWIRPETASLGLVQVMENVSHRGWLQSNAETFWKSISQRREQLEASRAASSQKLEALRYPIAQEGLVAISDTSDEGCRYLLAALEKSPRDLLIFATATPQKAGETAGSFTLRLATHAPCPVLILKRPLLTSRLTRNQNRLKVVFATDGSTASSRVLEKLPSLIRTDHLEVTVVTVVEPPVYQDNPMMAPYLNVEAIEEALASNADLILEMARKSLEVEGIRVENTLSLTGAPTYALLQYLADADPDLVVVGSHNRTGLAQWFLGSVSHRLVQSDNHSILIVR